MKTIRTCIRAILLIGMLGLGGICSVQMVQAAAYTEGIDVSSYNETIDWEQVKNQGKEFVMIKTGEGLYTGVDDSDRQFITNYEGAQAAGLKRGVYHMACHKTVEEAKQEARYCLQILNGRKLEYPVAYDIEYQSIFETGKENVTAMAKAFCDVIRSAGYTPMIYSYSSALNTYFDWSKLSGVKVWVAEYGENLQKPSFNGTYHMWQYSQSGVVAGANTSQGLCDLNKSYLDASRITLNVSAKTIGVKQAFTLTAKVTPSQSWDKVIFSSSNKSVATVNSKGKVTGVKAGTAVITAKAGNVSAKCKITVKVPSKVILPKAKISLKTGKTYTIKPKISNSVYCYKYTYTSSNKNVATVTSKGVVKARKKGTARITVKTFNGKKAVLTVTVTK